MKFSDVLKLKKANREVELNKLSHEEQEQLKDKALEISKALGVQDPIQLAMESDGVEIFFGFTPENPVSDVRTPVEVILAACDRCDKFLLEHNKAEHKVRVANLFRFATINEFPEQADIVTLLIKDLDVTRVATSRADSGQLFPILVNSLKKFDVAQVLINNGAKILGDDLAAAARECSSESLSFLLKNKAALRALTGIISGEISDHGANDVNLCDYWKVTPLTHALRLKDKTNAMLLLQNGAIPRLTEVLFTSINLEGGNALMRKNYCNYLAKTICSTTYNYTVQPVIDLGKMIAELLGLNQNATGRAS